MPWPHLDEHSGDGARLVPQRPVLAVCSSLAVVDVPKPTVVYGAEVHESGP